MGGKGKINNLPEVPSTRHAFSIESSNCLLCFFGGEFNELFLQDVHARDHFNSRGFAWEEDSDTQKALLEHCCDGLWGVSEPTLRRICRANMRIEFAGSNAFKRYLGSMGAGQEFARREPINISGCSEMRTRQACFGSVLF